MIRGRSPAAALAAALFVGACSSDGAGPEADETTSSASPTSEVTEVAIPDVVGMPIQRARQELQIAGLKSKVDGQPSPDATVAEQRPRAGYELSDGATVTIVPGVARPTETQVETLETVEVAVLFTGMIEGDGREAVINMVETIADSVDNLTYDIPTNQLALAVTSGWASPDNQIEAGWDIARALKDLWGSRDGAEPAEDLEWPGFTLTVDGHQFNCPGDAMRSVAEARMSRAEWEDACGR